MATKIYSYLQMSFPTSYSRLIYTWKWDNQAEHGIGYSVYFSQWQTSKAGWGVVDSLASVYSSFKNISDTFWPQNQCDSVWYRLSCSCGILAAHACGTAGWDWSSDTVRHVPQICVLQKAWWDAGNVANDIQYPCFEILVNTGRREAST